MNTNNSISPDYQRFSQAFSYDPDTGKLAWKITVNNRSIAGTEAGSITRKGYRVVGYQGKIYRVHRVAYLLMTGNWPTRVIDHINHDGLDNRWSNIRPASYSQNTWNQLVNKTSITGIKGVYLHVDKKTGNRYALAHMKTGDHRVQKTFSIRKFGEAGAMQMAEQYIRQIRESLHGDFAAH